MQQTWAHNASQPAICRQDLPPPLDFSFFEFREFHLTIEIRCLKYSVPPGRCLFTFQLPGWNLLLWALPTLTAEPCPYSWGGRATLHLGLRQQLCVYCEWCWGGCGAAGYPGGGCGRGGHGQGSPLQLPGQGKGGAASQALPWAPHAGGDAGK